MRNREKVRQSHPEERRFCQTFDFSPPNCTRKTAQKHLMRQNFMFEFVQGLNHTLIRNLCQRLTRDYKGRFSQITSLLASFHRFWTKNPPGSSSGLTVCTVQELC